MTNLLLDTKNSVLTITINREGKLNALNIDTLKELAGALNDAFNNPAIGGIVITGAGTKAFIAGADISEFASFTSDQGRQLAHTGHSEVFNLIESGPKPVLAAINGFALGGGLELAMACHIRIAVNTAKMGLPEVSLGLIPGYGGTQRLAQLVGKGRALEIILTADMISANEAWQYGLVNHVVEPDQLLNKATSLLAKIMLRSPSAVSNAIKAVNAGFKHGVNGYAIEIDEFAKCFGSEDFKEGVDAFLNKRSAEFVRR